MTTVLSTVATRAREGMRSAALAMVRMFSMAVWATCACAVALAITLMMATVSAGANLAILLLTDTDASGPQGLIAEV